MKNVNLDLLVDVVERLVPVLDEIVLVGGCATGLLVTDPGASSVRRRLMWMSSRKSFRVQGLSHFQNVNEVGTLGRYFRGGTSVPVDLRRIKTECNASGGKPSRIFQSLV